MDPLTIATITSGMLSNFASSEIKEVAQKLANRVFEAKKQHAEMHANPDLPIEKLRGNCLQKICDLQQHRAGRSRAGAGVC